MTKHKTMHTFTARAAATAALGCLATTGLHAAETGMTLDSGNTAWMITATILVLLMSIPGIALFYGGLVRRKNVLSVIMQTMLIVGVVSLLWVAVGYSWAFGTGFKDSGSPLAATRCSSTA